MWFAGTGNSKRFATQPKLTESATATQTQRNSCTASTGVGKRSTRLCDTDTMKARINPTAPIESTRNKYIPTKISSAMAGILNSARPLVYLKIRIDAPTATVMANKAKSAVIAVVTFSSLTVNKTKKGSTSSSGNRNVFDTKTSAGQAT